MLNIQPITLKGPGVQLEPLNETHRNALYNAAQDEAIWIHHSIKALGEHFHRWFDKALQGFQDQQFLPFIVRRLKDQKMIGSTRFYDIHPEHYRLSIGYTWYIKEVWGTSVNPECKFLLLKHLFEDLSVNRVQFSIDSRNSRSCAAVKKLGAKEEGILRQHIILENGYIRDSVIYSIVKVEWPRIKEMLQARM